MAPTAPFRTHPGTSSIERLLVSEETLCCAVSMQSQGHHQPRQPPAVITEEPPSRIRRWPFPRFAPKNLRINELPVRPSHHGSCVAASGLLDAPQVVAVSVVLVLSRGRPEIRFCPAAACHQTRLFALGPATSWRRTLMPSDPAGSKSLSNNGQPRPTERRPASVERPAHLGPSPAPPS